MKRLKQPAWTASLTAFLFGVAVHLFGLTNVLHNHDDIYQYPNQYGAGVASGRWMLQFMGDFFQKGFGNYNVIYLDGVIFLAFLALSAGLIVAVFEMRSRKLAAMVGMILVSFPAVTCTMFYRYTAPYYGVAFWFAMLAVWVVGRCRLGWLYSAILTACALGIYQAYLPVTAAVFVLLMLKQLLTEQVDLWTMVKRGLLYCGTMLLGLVFYYLMMELSLRLYGVTLSDYQGISEMGNLALAQIPALILVTLKSYLTLLTKDYCFLAQNEILKLCYLLTYISTVVLVVLALIRGKKTWDQVLMAVLLGILLPLAANAIQIMCPNSLIRTLMVYGVVVVLIAPLVLADCLPPLKGCWNRRISHGMLALILAIVLNYSYLNQVNYTAQYFANRQTETYISYLVTRVRMTEGFDTDKRWAFIGTVDDPMLEGNTWWKVEIYHDNKNSRQLINAYSRTAWIRNYLGYKVHEVKGEELEALRQTEAVQNMPCWPNEDSIQIIDDTIVIKFQ